MGTPLQKRSQVGAAGSGWPGANNITRSAWLDGSADYLSRSSVTGASTRKWSIFGAFRVTDFSARSRYIFECANGTSSQTALVLRTEQDLQFFDYSGGSANAVVHSDGLIRDSEWYTFLCVCDTANASAALRWRLYVNAVEQSTSRTNPSLNYDTSWNNGTSQHIGVQSYSSLQNYWEGSITAMLHADNTVLTPSDVWASDTAGTNGTIYYPKAGSALTALANSGGTASFFLSSDIGDGTDDSSKGNNFTAISMSDAVNGNDDTPTNPLPVFNNLHKSGVTVTLSEGGQRANLATGTGWLSVTQMVPPTGKYYVEFKANTVTGGEMAVGVCNPNSEQDASPRSSGFLHWEADGDRYLDGSQTATEVTAWAATNVVGLGINMDGKQLLFYDKDGNLDATVAFGSNVDGSDGVLLYLGNLSGSGAQNATLIAESAAMTHGLPSGYSELRIQSLPELSVQGADVFQTLLYTGNAANNRDITGAGFQPDFMWNKRRNGSQSHKLIDSSRGVTAVVASDSNGAEATETGLDSFQSDGIRVDNANSINDSGATYAAWLWKINSGTTASNGSGGITTTVQVASEGHISVATFTATGAATTYGHGLSSAPDFVTIKRRNGNDAWYTWMNGMGGTQYITLDTTDAVATNSVVYTALPTSTVVNGGTIFGAGTYVMYCFRNVPGLLQAGKYVGNGNVDGPVVLAGFQPRFLLIKGDTAGQEWQIYDTARNPTNDDSPVYLQPDNDSAEGTDHKDLDILANGFKLRDTTATINGNGTSYFYVAIADVATGTGLPPIPGR